MCWVTVKCPRLSRCNVSCTGVDGRPWGVLPKKIALQYSNKREGCIMVLCSKPKWKFWLKLQTQKLSHGLICLAARRQPCSPRFDREYAPQSCTHLFLPASRSSQPAAAAPAEATTAAVRR